MSRKDITRMAHLMHIYTSTDTHYFLIFWSILKWGLMSDAYHVRLYTSDQLVSIAMIE